MTAAPTSLPTDSEKSHPRTEAALQRLRNAMRDIEAEILENHGIYPFNYGRVTQSELCRRADVKKATLQNPVHKETTRVEIMNWLDGLSSKLMQTRESTRQRVTTVANNLSAELSQLTEAHQATRARLAAAEQLIEQLKQENVMLRGQLNLA